MKPTIKINFCDFYQDFDSEQNFLTDALSQKYNVLLSSDPDYLFYSVFGLEHLNFERAIKIFYSAENVCPNFNECDYAIGFDRLIFRDRYLHYPVYQKFISPEIQRRHVTAELAQRKFCNFIYSNAAEGEGAVFRQTFCRKLMRYKHVDCPGRVLHNMEASFADRYHFDWKESKINFLKGYKFTIAIENDFNVDYITEKLIHPYLAYSIPIYMGGQDLSDFNKKSMVHIPDISYAEAAVDQVIELNENNELYLAMLREPPMSSTFCFDKDERLIKFLDNIIKKRDQGEILHKRDPRGFNSLNQFMKSPPPSFLTWRRFATCLRRRLNHN